MMTLDNGAADRQANPHPAGLRCIERFEKFVHVLRFDANPRILHAQAYTIAFVSLGSDHDLPGTVLDADHATRSKVDLR
jgi:hypothetical protein